MDLEAALKTQRFLDEISLSVKKIIFANFPGLSDQEKEEIDQDVKLKILKMAARGKKIDNLRSYIWKMVYSTALDTIARRIPADCLDDVLASTRSPIESYIDTLSPEYLFEEKEVLVLVERAIDSLPSRRRSAVILHLQGLSLEETAVYLGESVNAARHLVYRGLGELEDQIKGLLADRPAAQPRAVKPARARSSRLEPGRT
jgi:RNA polymerase sigma factor (sigma-70 family)